VKRRWRVAVVVREFVLREDEPQENVIVEEYQVAWFDEFEKADTFAEAQGMEARMDGAQEGFEVIE
jgi:hypothetical protein